ncbi:MAG TPA: hypothetical protein VGQ99_00215 [Tepidisphaeraceae bacterium]|jgi:hypothetical protein|nr:hypothetical protein [Tepidisphaeraceae bacterium]
MRRILKPKTKERRFVPVPDDLRASLQEVWQLIQDAERDSEVSIDFDDAIQVGSVCGGRVGNEPHPFVLTYDLPGDTDRGRWSLTLHPTEIEDIADGVLTSLPMYCCTSPACRCKFREADEYCFHCDYEEDPNHGTFTFSEAIPHLESLGVRGLSEASTLENAKAVLGEPFKTGGGAVVGGLKIHPWAKFWVGTRKVHIQFWSESGRIKAVTL